MALEFEWPTNVDMKLNKEFERLLIYCLFICWDTLSTLGVGCRCWWITGFNYDDFEFRIWLFFLTPFTCYLWEAAREVRTEGKVEGYSYTYNFIWGFTTVRWHWKFSWTSRCSCVSKTSCWNILKSFSVSYMFERWSYVQWGMFSGGVC